MFTLSKPAQLCHKSLEHCQVRSNCSDDHFRELEDSVEDESSKILHLLLPADASVAIILSPVLKLAVD